MSKLLRIGGLVTALASMAAATAQGQAQGYYAPVMPADGTPPVGTTQLQAAIAAATPQPCPAQPQDMLAGASGVLAPCMPRMDATRPTVVQAGNVATDASGNWSITFAKPFTSSAPYVHAEPVTPGATLPYDCNVTARTATTAQGTCYQSYSTTLGGTLTSVLNAAVSPFRAAAAGMAVMVVARDPTQ